MTSGWPATLLKVSVGSSVRRVPIADILDFFWTQSQTSGLVCDICARPFNRELGPSIRTISVQEDSYQDGAPISDICVTDRHRHCLQASGDSYVPISHVWHEPVRTAHETGKSSPEACNLVYQSPLKILQSARKSFGPGTQIWHDYLSVPQWCSDVQQEILLLIPAIYHMPTKIIVHLEDLDTSHAQSIANFAAISNDGADSAEQMEERYAAAMAFYQCRWMKRVWVTLEFARSRRSCLMDSSHRIWRIDGAFSGSFVWFSQQCSHNYVMTYSHFPARQAFMQSTRYVSRGQDIRFRGRSLGDTMDELATRECKYHRDRFLAIHASLGTRSYEQNARDIPVDTTGACRWVWTQAMMNGDYSPLLMQPIGGREGEAYGLSWLVGHEDMNFHTWDLGRIVSPAQRQHVVTDQAVVAPVLEYVGTVETMHPFPLDDGPMAAFATFVDTFLETEQCSAGKFIDAALLVFPIYQFIALFAQDGVADYQILPTSRAECLEQDPDIENKVQAYLQHLFDRPPNNSDPSLRQKSLSSLVSLLQLDKKFGPMAKDNRLLDIGKRFQQRRDIDPNSSERLCHLRCQYCRKTFFSRPDLRPEAAVGAKLYRIPGLSYTMTSAKGVGILVNEKGRIVGRSRCAIPLCDCKQSETVIIS